MSDELSELKENAEHGEGGLAAVTVTMAIFAVFVAAVSLLGHRADTDALLNQTKSTDQWAYYQAKNSRSHEMEGVADMLGTLSVMDKEKAEMLREKYTKESERYEKEKEQASDKAKEFEEEKGVVARRGDRFDAAEVLLEIALIICSLTLLTKKRVFWLASIAVGIVGVLVAASGFLLH